MVLPSRKCPHCKKLIEIPDAPIYKGREYCSDDCAIDAYLCERSQGLED